jgi:hypothetical protein
MYLIRAPPLGVPRQQFDNKANELELKNKK